MVEYYNWSNTGSFALDQTRVISHGRIQRGGGRGQGVWTLHPGKSQVAIDFLRVTGTDPPREALKPSGPVASRLGNFEWSSVKYVDALKKGEKRTP